MKAWCVDKVNYDIDLCILMHNIPKELDESEIISFCQPFGGFKKLYMLKDKKKRFLGDAVVEWGLLTMVIL